MNIFLVEERERLGLKAKDVANHANIAIPTQSNYENGKRYPDAQYLFKLSQLGFDMNFVITGKRHVHNATPKESMLLELFRKAPEAVQNHIIAGLLTDNTLGSSSVTVGNNNTGNVAGGNQNIR